MSTTTLASLRILIGAETSGAVSGLAGAEQALARLARQATATTSTTGRMTKGLGESHFATQRLTTALGGLAHEALGLDPKLFRIGELLGDFALGASGTLAVVGGLALIGQAIERINKPFEELAKSIEAAKKAGEELMRSQAFGAKAPILQQKATLGVRQETLSEDMGSIGAEITKAQTEQFRGWQNTVARLTAKLEPLRAEFSKNEEGLKAFDRALEEIDADAAADSLKKLISSLDELNAKARDLDEKVRADVNAHTGLALNPKAFTQGFFGPGFGNATAEAARAKVQANAADIRNRPDWVVKALALTLKPMEKFDDSVHDFATATDQFLGGVKSAFKATFSLKDRNFGAIGDQLASGAISAGIGLAADALFKGVSSLLNRESPAEKALREAIEKNTAALTASSSFLHRQIVGTGLGEGKDNFAQLLSNAIQEQLDRQAIGKGSVSIEALIQSLALPYIGDPNSEFGINFPAAEGKVNAWLDQLVNSLGLDLGDLTPTEALRTLEEALSRAGYAAGDLADAADQAAAALRNVPAGFKIALARFNATDPVQSAARGGAYPFQPAYQRAG